MIEVPTARGGWRVEEPCESESEAEGFLEIVQRKYPEARIVKYTPEVEDD